MGMKVGSVCIIALVLSVHGPNRCCLHGYLMENSSISYRWGIKMFVMDRVYSLLCRDAFVSVLTEQVG